MMVAKSQSSGNQPSHKSKSKSRAFKEGSSCRAANNSEENDGSGSAIYSSEKEISVPKNNTDTELALQAHTIKRHLQGTLKEDLIPLMVHQSLIRTLNDSKCLEAAHASVDSADIVDFRDLPVHNM